jgi:hypothetical protein
MPKQRRLQEALGLILDEPAPNEFERLTAEELERRQRERRHGTPAAWPDDWRRVKKVDYFYRRDTILVRTDDVDLVLHALREDQQTPEEREAARDQHGPILSEDIAIDRLPVIDGVTGLVWRYGRTAERVRGDRPGHFGGTGFGREPDGDGPDLLATPYVLRRLDERIGVGKATPDHALSLCGNGHPCPATEPAVVSAAAMGPVPATTTGICCGTPGWDGDGVRVGVVDGGLVKDATTMWPWMAGIRGDREDPYVAGKHIKPYACHGTFVAGCVRTTAPKAQIRVKKAEYVDSRPCAGMAYEHEIVQRMHELLNWGADVIVCEFDGFTRFHRPMHTFDAFYDKRLRHVNAVVVAPAGNDATQKPTFPAAYSWVIGVGSLTANGNSRSGFSNHGGWVDVYAPGEELVNAFAVGDYRCVEKPHKWRLGFRGLANWSGTSFSAPLVAGLIAARMSATGENAPRAAAALLRFALDQARPGIGPILLPHQACGTPRKSCGTGCDCACGCAVLS